MNLLTRLDHIVHGAGRRGADERARGEGGHRAWAAEEEEEVVVQGLVGFLKRKPLQEKV